jgi:hypothetical protein
MLFGLGVTVMAGGLGFLSVGAENVGRVPLSIPWQCFIDRQRKQIDVGSGSFLDWNRLRRHLLVVGQCLTEPVPIFWVAVRRVDAHGLIARTLAR